MFRKILSDSVVYGASRILMMAVSMFLVPIYSRMFTKADYGVLETFNSLTNILTVFLTTGVFAALYRYIYDLDHADKKKYFSSVYIYMITVTVSTMLLGYIFRHPITHFIIGANAYTRFLIVSIVLGCLGAITTLNLEICRSQFKKVQYLFLSVGTAGTLAGLGVLFVVKYHLGLFGFFYAALITQLFFMLLGTFLNRKDLQFYFSYSIIKKILAFSLPFVPAAIGGMLLKYVDRIVLLKVMDPKTALDNLGMYSMSVRVSNIFELVGIAFSTAWFPWAMKVADQDDAKSIYSNMFNNIVILFAILVGLFNSSQFFILKILADKKFLDAYQYVYLLTFATIINYLSYVLNLGVNITKKTKYVSVPTIVSGVINILLAIPLTRHFGIPGVTISLFISSCIYTYLAYRFSYHYYPIKFEFFRNIGTLFLAMIWLLLIYIDDRLYHTHLLLNISIKVLLAAFFITIFYWFNHEFRNKAQSVIAALIKKYIQRPQNTVS